MGYNALFCQSQQPSMSVSEITAPGFDNDCNKKQTTLTPSAHGFDGPVGTAMDEAFGEALAYPLRLIVPASAKFTPPLPTPGHDDPRGISQAAKIAIGIAVPLAVIFLFIVFFLGRKLYRRRAKQGMGAPALASHPGSLEYPGKPELQADNGITMTPMAGALFQMPELDHHGAVVSQRPELEGVQGQWEIYSGQTTFPSELPPNALVR